MSTEVSESWVIMQISLMQVHKRAKLRAPLAATVNTPHCAACFPDLSAGKRDAELSTQTRLKQQEAIQTATELRKLG